MKPNPKPKTCKVCKGKFMPFQSTQIVCSSSCALSIVAKDRARLLQKAGMAARAEYRARREKQKTRSDWLREAQSIANRYARIRDSKDGCISCDKPATWGGQWHGSHFRSTAAASAVRLNLWNIHKACSICNRHLSGNIAGYRPRLIQKIGSTKVTWLEAQNHLARYEIDYLRRYKQIMGKRLRRMEKGFT